jgi:hypothetical protein
MIDLVSVLLDDEDPVLTYIGRAHSSRKRIADPLVCIYVVSLYYPNLAHLNP